MRQAHRNRGNRRNQATVTLLVPTEQGKYVRTTARASDLTWIKAEGPDARTIEFAITGDTVNLRHTSMRDNSIFGTTAELDAFVAAYTAARKQPAA